MTSPNGQSDNSSATPAPVAASPPAPGAGSTRATSTDTRQLVLVCTTQFMGWAGFGAILPYLPVFLKEQAHARVWMIGVVASAYFVGTFLFSSPFGRLSDTIGRKPVIILGSVLYAVATFLFMTTRDPWWFLAFRFVEGIGAAAVGPAGNAFIADITPEEKRSSAYGWLITAQFGGLVAGPLLGAAIMGLASSPHASVFGRLPWDDADLRGFYAIFLVGSLTMAVIAVLLALFLHEPAHVTRRRHEEGRDKAPKPSYRSLITRPIFAFLLVAATGHFAMGAWEVIWSIWLRHLGASMRFIGWTWAAFSLPMLLSFVGGRLADRGNRFWLMFSGYIISACTWIVYGSTSNLTAFLVLSVLEGFAVAWSFPAKLAFLVQCSPRRWVGTIQGMETTAVQLAALIGTLTAPLIYEVIGGFAIGVGGIVSLVGIAIAAPILYREWQRIVASGELIRTSEAERLASVAAAASPVEDVHQL